MTTIRDLNAETRVLLETGRDDAPSAALVHRIIRRVHEEETRLSQFHIPSRRTSLGRALRFAVAAAAMIAVSVWMLWKPEVQGPQVLVSAEPEAIPVTQPQEAPDIRAPEPEDTGNVQPKAATSAAVTPPVASATRSRVERTAKKQQASANERQSEKLQQAQGSEVVPRSESNSARTRISDPTVARFAAEQRLQRDEHERQAAAARASAAQKCVRQACQIIRPGDSLITDFADIGLDGVFVDNDAYSARPTDWYLNFYGSVYVYPTEGAGLSQTTRGKWRIRGRVSDWAGFGLWLGPCMVDFSAYRGVSFELWGKAGPAESVVFRVDTDANSPPDECRSNVGSCRGGEEACVSPVKRLSVSEQPGRRFVVLWDQVKGGRPRNTPDPARIVQLRWSFEWSAGASADSAYPVDITIDNMRLVK